MKILALDLGISTGWAVSAGDSTLLESGVQRFDLSRGESPGCRFLRFRSWLAGILDMTAPALVAYERAHHRGGHATELAIGLQTRVQELAAAREIPYAAVHTGTLKKHATGSGAASKEMMILAARKRWPDAQAIESDDQADALLVLSWALEEYGGEA